jgi:hypothetical protein
MTLTPAAKIELIEAALADGKYRTLQKQLRQLRDAQEIRLKGYLSDSHESLKAEAQRIILELKPIAETQDATLTATVERKVKKVLASLPAGTITNNSDFGDRINTGTADEKIWLVKKDRNGVGVTFVKTECGRYYESYAGDAIRSIALLKVPTFVEARVLRTLVAVPDAVCLQEDAQKLGLTLHLCDRTSDIETPQDVSTTKTATGIEVPIPEPQVYLVTAPNHPEIWDMLLERKRINDSRSSEAVKVETNPCPYPKIDELISETIMGLRYGLTALWHPTNHPDVDLDKLIKGGYGLRAACDLIGSRYPYLFHESQLKRLSESLDNVEGLLKNKEIQESKGKKMPEIRSSEQIKTELQQTKEIHAKKIEERDAFEKQLEALENEIVGLLKVRGRDRFGKIAELEKELYLAQMREYKEQLPKPVLTLVGNKWDKSDYRVEKVTAKRIYITAVGTNDFYVNRDGSDTWAQKWGLDIEATIKRWEQFQINNSPNRKP